MTTRIEVFIQQIFVLCSKKRCRFVHKDAVQKQKNYLKSNKLMSI